MTVHSDIKTALLGLIAAAAFIAAAIVSVTPARSEPLQPSVGTGHPRIFGSSQSRRLSPNMLKANTASVMARPGNRIIHGALL